MLYKDFVLLEKYQIIRMLGRGGMSCVWLAEDLTLNKKWAVKEIFKNSKEYQAALNPDGNAYGSPRSFYAGPSICAAHRGPV